MTREPHEALREPAGASSGPVPMRLSSVALLLCFLGCVPLDLNEFAERYTTPSERAFALEYLRLLSNAQVDQADARLAPELRSDTVGHVFQIVGDLLHEALLDSLHYIGVNIFAGPPREVNLTYEVPTTKHDWVVTNVATRSEAQAVMIGFSARRYPRRLEDLHAFTLKGKSTIHYVWLALALLMPIVTATTAVRVARARGMPRRWLWTFAALIASPLFTLNWTTGEPAYATLAFNLFGAGFSRPGAAAPWSLTFALPIGAAVAYLRLRAWRSARGQSSEAPV